MDKNGLRGARIGVARQFFGNNAKLKAVTEPHFEALKNAGATLVDVTFPTVPNFGDMQREVLLYEFKTDLNKYLVQRNAPYKTLSELIKFNEDNKDREMPLFGQELFLQAEKKGDLNEAAYVQALQKLKTATQAEGIDAVMAKDKLDAVVSPTVGGTWSLAAIAGYPYITVPAGFVDGLPSGVAFFVRAFSEPQLIKFTYAFEQLTRAQQTPKYLPTLPNA